MNSVIFHELCDFGKFFVIFVNSVISTNFVIFLVAICVKIETKIDLSLLATAMTKPVIKPKERSPASSQPVIERYPNVFDSFAETQHSAGFIQGTKMVLPVGFERNDDKKSEEVHIPASSKAPVNVGKNLVPISSLDYIGQMAFQGIKNLNRIQSVVFDTAYRTNENMLVCAPTGIYYNFSYLFTLSQLFVYNFQLFSFSVSCLFTFSKLFVYSL